MLGFELAMLDAVAHATMPISPPTIERSIASFMTDDSAEFGNRQLETGRARLQQVISTGQALRAEINVLKKEVGSDALPLVDRTISLADQRLKERIRFFDHERKLVPRYRKVLKEHSPEHLPLYDALEVSWREVRQSEHDELVDFLCFLRAVRSDIDADGRAVVATFNDAESWRRYARQLVS